MNEEVVNMRIKGYVPTKEEIEACKCVLNAVHKAVGDSWVNGATVVAFINEALRYER